MKKIYEAARAELLITEDELLNGDIDVSPVTPGDGGIDMPEDDF